MTFVRRIVALLFAPLFLFVFNLAICGRLLRIEYLDQMQSIEGAFIAMAVYIQRHWPGYDWFPLWRSGTPFARVYQPALHYSVATLATLTGFSVVHSYHILTAITYSLGAVAFYLLARVLGAGRLTAFWSSLVFSVFSPSALLAGQVRRDMEGRLYGRRLQALVYYGEGPNVTGLLLAMLALAALHVAMQKRTALSGLIAALAIAAVPATSWPGAMALAMGIVAYFLAQSLAEMKTNLVRFIVIGLGAWAFASPFALLSTMRITLTGLAAIQDPPTVGSLRWITLALVFAAMFVVRAILLRSGAPVGLRFAALWTILTAGIVLPNYYRNIRLISNPARFHLAMEIAVVLTICLAAAYVRLPRNASCYLAGVMIFICIFLGFRCRNYALSMIRPVDITHTVEYQEARWAEINLHGARIMAPGSISFWMNIFTETPQAAGGFDMSLSNIQNLAATWIVWNGYENDALSADFSLLWLKAYAVEAVGTGNERSREYYRGWKRPDRFVGRLTRAWPEGNARADDEIYLVPERSSSLARVVPRGLLIRHPPANGIDATEMRPFVNAVDDPSLPLASFAWLDANHAKIDGTLTRDEAIEVAINYDPGWSATANGRPVAVHADGLGFIAMEPQCDGVCDVELKWSAGAEPIISWCAALAALAVALGLIWRERHGR